MSLCEMGMQEAEAVISFLYHEVLHTQTDRHADRHTHTHMIAVKIQEGHDGPGPLT